MKRSTVWIATGLAATIAAAVALAMPFNRDVDERDAHSPGKLIPNIRLLHADPPLYLQARSAFG